MSLETPATNWRECVNATERAQIELSFAFAEYSIGSSAENDPANRQRFNQIVDLFRRAHSALDAVAFAVRGEHDKMKGAKAIFAPEKKNATE